MIYEHCSGWPPRVTSLSELLGLAHDVYSDVRCHVTAMLCLVHQGRVGAALQYAIVTDGCHFHHIQQVQRTSRLSMPVLKT